MTNRLTHEQVAARFEASLLPHKARATIHDSGKRITVTIRSAKDGSLIDVFQSSSMHEMQVEHHLRDVIDGVKREVDNKQMNVF